MSAPTTFNLTELLGAATLEVKGEEYPTSNLAGKVVAFYFSAGWCGPCKMFTPQLINAYKASVAAGLPFQVVFVSSDQESEEFDEYYGKMPWAAVKFAEEDLRDELKVAFNCKGIPQLSVLEPQPGAAPESLQFSVITHLGKAQVAKDKEKVIAEWCAEAAAQSKAAAPAAAAPADGFSTSEAF